MTFLVLAILLQIQIGLPQRIQLENPSVAHPLARKTQKDFDKLWKRFLSGKDDSKVSRDLQKLLRKSEEPISLLLFQVYVDLYSGKSNDAERELQEILSRDPSNSTALFYLADLAYSRGDFVTATAYFQRLQSVDSSISGIEMKSQRALLLALEALAVVRDGRR